jgi:formylmethanofuran dehydrogenase subunit B
MAEAWIRGEPVTLEAAASEAARLLRASRMPVIAGLGTDVAGVRAAIALARQVGGAIDHMHAAALLRDLDVMRESGMMTTTPNEARLRADLLLLVGPALMLAWPELRPRLIAAPQGVTRRVVWLCGGSEAETAGAPVEMIGGAPETLPVLLATLRARCGGRPAGATDAAVEALATDLGKATFGVAVWSAATLDALTVEMLCGLVRDLNATTRFSGLPLAPADDAAAVLQASGWLAGLPPRTGFARGDGEHDPWRFDAVRLVESGEADCAVWISAWGATPPAWQRGVPTVVLAHDETICGTAEVAIAVGRPGVDHDAVSYLAATGTLAPLLAAQKSAAVSVADALDRIAAQLPAGAPC